MEQKCLLTYGLSTVLSMNQRPLLVPGCWPMYRSSFLFVKPFHARHVRNIHRGSDGRFVCAAVFLPTSPWLVIPTSRSQTLFQVFCLFHEKEGFVKTRSPQVSSQEKKRFLCCRTHAYQLLINCIFCQFHPEQLYSMPWSAKDNYVFGEKTSVGVLFCLALPHSAAAQCTSLT